MSSDLYLIDANVLIEAANNYYAFDRVPGFWTWLRDQCEAGLIRTASLVAGEVEFPPELTEWMLEAEASGFYVDVSDNAVQAAYATMADWIVGQPYGPEHIAKFLDGADLWIIAAAQVHGATVVTQEQAAGAGTRKIKIPNVCDQFGVRCNSTFEMLDALKARF